MPSCGEAYLSRSAAVMAALTSGFRGELFATPPINGIVGQLQGTQSGLRTRLAAYLGTLV